MPHANEAGRELGSRRVLRLHPALVRPKGLQAGVGGAEDKKVNPWGLRFWAEGSRSQDFKEWALEARLLLTGRVGVGLRAQGLSFRRRCWNFVRKE